jgi:RimJ/RimL family protein N-acetyltransferase
MSSSPSPVVRLRAVDESTLSDLVRVALADAAPDEVTPPLTPGEDWTPERISWLTAFHTDRRSGLEGPAREATWAVEVDGGVAGAVRLKRTGEAGVLEVGIWLTRGVRGRGVGPLALAAALGEAAAWGAGEVRAVTRSGNAAALAVLGALGFECTETGDGEVRARRGVG